MGPFKADFPCYCTQSPGIFTYKLWYFSKGNINRGNSKTLADLLILESPLRDFFLLKEGRNKVKTILQWNIIPTSRDLPEILYSRFRNWFFIDPVEYTLFCSLASSFYGQMPITLDINRVEKC